RCCAREASDRRVVVAVGAIANAQHALLGQRPPTKKPRTLSHDDLPALQPTNVTIYQLPPSGAATLGASALLDSATAQANARREVISISPRL
ncbi:hypothetical protein T492DRAFT_907641, partial [Pavlovales sp. CCMP2436]